MLSVENHPLSRRIGKKISGITDIDTLNCNRSNGTQTDHVIVVEDDKSQISALEKNLCFLRSQHEIMLKSLHDEIENLRRTNKALQFRLVMCCCSNTNDQKAKKKTCAKGEDGLNEEVVELKNLLEEERKKNEILVKQLESVQISRLVAIDDHVEQQLPLDSKNKLETEQVIVRQKSESLRRTTNETRASKHSSHTKDRNVMEANEIVKTVRTSNSAQMKDAAGNRIISPELNPDSSSSAILLTPRTTIGMPDGFWVRPSVASLQNKLLPATGTTPRVSAQLGSQILPVKLPVLRTSGSLNHVTVRDTTKDVLSSNVLQSDAPVLDDHKEEDHQSQRNQSNAMRSSRSARACLGHNAIAIFDPLHDSPPSASAADIRAATRSYAPNLGPFLPALPKSNDTGQAAARARKAREIQRKRLHNAHNWFPS